MIELNNVRISMAGTAATDALSVIVGEGESLLVHGATAALRHAVMETIMGLRPVAGGYLTISGELVTPASAPYFRRQMAYVPADVALSYQTVRDMVSATARLKANRPNAGDMEALADEWRHAGIADDCYEQPLAYVAPDTLRLMMLAVAKWLRKSVVLAEEVDAPAVAAYLRSLAADGTSVVVTCATRAEGARYDKYIDLDHPSQQ